MPPFKPTPEYIKELQDLLTANSHIKKLYFTSDGNYHVNAYPYEREGAKEKKLYSRVGMLHTAGSKEEAILDEFLIVYTVDREAILAYKAEKVNAAEPAGEKEPVIPAKAPPTAPVKAADKETAPKPEVKAAATPAPAAAPAESTPEQTKN